MLVETDVRSAESEVQESETVQRRRNKYSRDFKTEAARLVVHDGARLTDVAKKFHVPDQTLSNWVRKERQSARRKGASAPATSGAPTQQVSSARDRMEIERLTAALAKEKDRADTFEKAAILFIREKDSISS